MPFDRFGGLGQAQAGKACGEPVQGQLEFQPRQPGAQAVVCARPERQGGRRQGAKRSSSGRGGNTSGSRLAAPESASTTEPAGIVTPPTSVSVDA